MKPAEHNLLTILAECSFACNACSTACLEEKDVRMMSDCIKLDMDCAQICELTAAFFGRGSAHTIHIMKECAEICSQCADECGKHADMDHCKRCAEACRKCAKACLAYVDGD
jgi:hypothetical protein